LILSAFSAYAFSFAVDLLAGGAMRVYPSTAFLPVVTWSVLATVAVLAAVGLKAAPWTIWTPFALFAVIALAGAAVGHHRQNWAVAAFMVLQTLFVRRATRPSPTQHVVNGLA
jgi:hypothetical protein